MRQVVGQNLLEHRAQRGFLGGVEGEAEVARNIPVGEQVKLASEQCAIVFGQDAGSAGALDVDQCSVGVAVKRARASGVEYIKVGRIAEVGKQQEAEFQIFGIDSGDMHASVAEKRSNLQKRAAILVLWWGVHDDLRAAVRECDAEIAPETGVGRCRFERVSRARVAVGKVLVEPLAQQFGTRHAASP